MAEVIQFSCPACDTTLRLPLELAGLHGPCPGCSREIIAPDPATNTAASLAPAPSSPEPPPEPPQTPEPAPSLAPASSRAVLPLSCALTGVLALAAGYWAGHHFQPTPSQPANQIVHQTAAPAPTPEPPKPTPEKKEPAITEKPPAGEPSPPVKHIRVLDAAETALRSFLNAPDWQTRLAHSLFPETTGPAMEARAARRPDGPVPFNSISVSHTQTDVESRDTLLIFQVATPSIPGGIPVAVMESADGWRVDWRAFIEFHDDEFQRFTESPATEARNFHLVVRAHEPEGENAQTNEHYETYLIGSPVPKQETIAYVRRGSAASSTLRDAIDNRGIFTPVLEVAKRTTPDEQTYLEILHVTAPTWRPADR